MHNIYIQKILMYITINRGKDVGIFITMISLRSIVSQNVSEENFWDSQRLLKSFLG